MKTIRKEITLQTETVIHVRRGKPSKERPMMKRIGIAAAAFVLCIAATQWAMRGRHEPTGNTGFLGTELAGVEGTAGNAASVAVRGEHPGGATGELGGDQYGVRGSSNTTGVVGFSGVGTGVIGNGIVGVRGYGINAYGVYGEATGDASVGVYGAGATGMRGVSFLGVGVSGSGANGVQGISTDGFGVIGQTSSGTAVYGRLDPGGTGHAGWFEGRAHVNGLLTKSAGAFRIDHPLDPSRKYLSHSFVESPDMKNIYDGVITLGADGTAVVELPDWFGALNTDFRYQLTCIGEHAPVYVADEIADNRFRIAGGYADMKVSWQVTGTRNDPFANAHRIAVEEMKPPRESGRFLHPELYGQSRANAIGK
jgi:hypothetical protein